MSEPEDIDALAGEYVLGTLDAAERAEVAARRLREPALDEAILAWEYRLAPLCEVTPEVAPEPSIWAGIQARLDARNAGREDPSIADLTQRLKRWKTAAILSGAAAACLAISIVWRETVRPSPAENFVAVLQRDTESPAFIVEVDLRSRLMTVRPVAAGRQPGKSYELWLIHDSLGAPKSLGVVADQGFTVRAALTRYDQSVVEDGTYAITLEQAGGAPDGKPSGAPLWTGKLVQATP